MASCHLVAGLHTALHRQIHLDHLEHARSEIVARRDLGLLLLEALFECLALSFQALGYGLQLRIRLLFLEADLEPLLAWQIGEVRIVYLRAGLDLLRTRFRGLALDHAAHALEQIIFQDALLIGQVLAHALELRFLDCQGARILLDAVAGEHAHVDHRAVHAGRHTQRGVFDVGRLLAEDRPQQLLFRRQLGLALRRDLAHQDVAGAHFGADEGDTRFVELGESRITDVGDVGGDFLRPQFGVARDTGELFNVNGREAVFFDYTLGDQNGVFEVVAVPRHERDQQILAKRELAEIGRWTVRQHVAAFDRIAGIHQRPLVDAGVLVRTRVLGERVDIDARFAGGRFIVVHAHHDA